MPEPLRDLFVKDTNSKVSVLKRCARDGDRISPSTMARSREGFLFFEFFSDMASKATVYLCSPNE